MTENGTAIGTTLRLPLIYGWAALAFFMGFGLFLESLHLLKSPFYFEVEIRRELWVLAHTHGGLLALANLVFAGVGQVFRFPPVTARTGGRLLVAAGVLMPSGFFFGGIGNSETDPSLWILLTPLGAVCAIAAALVALVASIRSTRKPTPAPEPTPKARKPAKRH